MVESENPKPAVFSRVHLLFLCGLFSVLPLMCMQSINLWSRPHFRFFPAAWMLFALVILSEPKIGFAASPLRRRVGIGLTLAGMLVSLLAAILISPGLSQLALMVIVTGWILVWLGIVPWTRLVALTGLLWITWPPPMNLDSKLIGWLHDRAARTVSPLLDLIGTPNLLFARNLDLRSDRIELANIIGGLDSVFFLAFFAIVLLLAFRRPLAVSALVLLLVPVLSWLQSAVHVLILTWAQESLGADWTVGSMHVGLSIGLFVLSLVFLLMVIDGVSFLLEPLPVELAQQAVVGFHGLYNRFVLWPGHLSIGGGDADDDDYFDEDEDAPRNSRGVSRQGPPVRLTMKASDPWRGRQLTWGVAAGFLLIGALGAIGCVITTTAEPPSLPSYSDQQLASIASADALPAETHGLKFVTVQLLKPEPSNNSSAHTIVWRYNAVEGAPLLSLDFPHYGMQWRWLNVPASGWKFKAPPRRLIIGDSGSAGWPVVEVEMVNDLRATAYALYSAFDLVGNPAVPEDRWGSSFSRRMLGTVFGKLINRSTELPVTFQTQLFLESSTSLSDSRKSELRAAMVEATAAMKQRVLGGIGK